MSSFFSGTSWNSRSAAAFLLCVVCGPVFNAAALGAGYVVFQHVQAFDPNTLTVHFEKSLTPWGAAEFVIKSNGKEVARFEELSEEQQAFVTSSHVVNMAKAAIQSGKESSLKVGLINRGAQNEFSIHKNLIYQEEQGSSYFQEARIDPNKVEVLQKTSGEVVVTIYGREVCRRKPVHGVLEFDRGALNDFYSQTKSQIDQARKYGHYLIPNFGTSNYGTRFAMFLSPSGYVINKRAEKSQGDSKKQAVEDLEAREKELLKRLESQEEDRSSRRQRSSAPRSNRGSHQ